METDPSTSADSSAPKWRPLNSRQRRVVGVLIEKAKTTPDAYPMTLNGLTNGCNQKSNRAPQMTLKPDDVETILEELRELGAVTEVQTSGRVPKFRHQMYDWLGVDKLELAVMAELLLRGEQTIGELRARASRMEPIPGMEELRPVLRSLMEKKLVVSLTPEGRGQIVSHGLYKDRELTDLQARATALGQSLESGSEETPAPSRGTRQAGDERLEQLQSEVDELRAEVADLRRDLEQLKSLMT